LEQFTNENAPSLRGRPKIFFFQTCRWDMHCVIDEVFTLNCWSG
jgi:hypothetical protein